MKHDDLTPHDLIELFEREGWRGRWARTWHGLRCPRGSGENLFARRQLARCGSAGLAAVGVPMLFLLLLAVLRPPATTMTTWTVIHRPTPKPEKPLVDPPAPDEPLDPVPTPTMDFDKTFAPPSRDPVAAAPPQPVHGDVSLTKSPVASRCAAPRFNIGSELFKSRSSANREAARERHGAPDGSEDVILRALRWLKANQDPSGAWGDPKPAMTGLALLAFLAHGETAASPEFGDNVRGAIEWLVANQESDGRFRGRDAHDYSHPIAAYALAEAVTLTRNPMLKAPARRAINVIVTGQHASGGWDYNCKISNRDDTSYMGWCAQALKAAYVANLDVPGLERAMERAVEGFCANASPSGGFGYTGPGNGGLTGVGVLGLQMLGQPRRPEALRGLQWLERVTFDWGDPWGQRPLYYWYYVTQSKFMAGGSTWHAWNRAFARKLANAQSLETGDNGEELGYWTAPGKAVEAKHGPVYSTTLCTLMLEVYYRYSSTTRPVAAIAEEAPEEGPVTIGIEWNKTG